MSDLHPTPTRLRLLRAVAAGEVYRAGDQNAYDAWEYRVTARVIEMVDAGWVADYGASNRLGRPLYELTPAGKAVLDEHLEVPR